ncbi:MAG TPA: hypothetical protein VIF60_24610, partial [Burkholderiaceae bacterium]
FWKGLSFTSVEALSGNLTILTPFMAVKSRGRFDTTCRCGMYQFQESANHLTLFECKRIL